MNLSGIPPEFVFFGLTLAGIALFHKQSFPVALTGFLLVSAYKLFFSSYNFEEHILGTPQEEGEWKILVNLFGLLTGFALLARHFEDSRLPRYMPALLPDDWKGGFVLLLLIAVMSSFLDNIAAALIGVSVARVVFREKLHLGYLAAIVAASNAGGAGSVLGDTTTTMLWIAGVPAFHVLDAYIASGTALLFFSFFTARQQQNYHPILKHERKGDPVDFRRLTLVLLILGGAIITNIAWNFPAAGVWLVLITGSFFIPTDWKELLPASKSSLFLLCLVMMASMMPVESLPAPTWFSTLLLGFVSAFFDNIPLTKLAIDQGGYDWGLLAYAVGYGGSMLWFGSSAGVAVAGKFEQAKSTGEWIKKGWPVIVAYLLGFAALMMTLGWHPVPLG